MKDLKMNDDFEHEVESYVAQLKQLEWEYRKLEKKYHKMQMKNQDLTWVIRKQNQRIQKLQGEKDHYHNEPKVVRKARGKMK